MTTNSNEGLQGVVRHDFRAETAMSLLDPDLALDTALENLWICILVTSSGRAIVGYGSCEPLPSLDGERGRQLAYDDALRQLRHPRPSMVSPASERASNIAVLKLGSAS